MATFQDSGLLDRLQPDAAQFLERAVRAAAPHGYPLHLVGGIVRDLILGRKNLDLDLVVEGDAIAVARSVFEELGGRLVTHQQFGTATIYVDHIILDVAMARTESYPRPGALPVVRPGAIGDDLHRRDFTINAMALSLNAATSGQVIDPLGGRHDLERGLVRVIHDRSFIDDATRLLRAVRYEQRFGFALEPGTEALGSRDAPMLSTISPDRVRYELERILEESRPELALGRAQALGILSAVHPSLPWSNDLSVRFAQAREESVTSPLLYFGLWATTFLEEDLPGIANRLRLPLPWARVAREAVRLMGRLDSLAAPGLAPSRLHGLLEGYSPEAVRACRLATGSAIIRGRLDLFIDSLSKVKPLLNGRDLQALGVPVGPRVGRALEALKRARLDGELATKEEEAAFVRRWQAAAGPGG